MNRKEIDIEEARKFYESGMTLADVAEKFDVSGYCIRKKFINAGIPRRKQGGIRPVKPTNRKTRICACCGINAVPNNPVNGVKLTRLCINCYKYGDNRMEVI